MEFRKMGIFTCLPILLSRLKTLRSTCNEISAPVVKIRITIQDVYPGSKWQDTAISAIMFPEYCNKAKDWRYRYNNDTGKYEVCKIEKK